MKRSSYLYTKYYCEENVYKFLEKEQLTVVVEQRKAASSVPKYDLMFACFMSSYSCPEDQEKKNHWQPSVVPICVYDVEAAAIFQLEPLTIWDYHVVAVVREASSKRWFVVDFDSCLSCGIPCDAEKPILFPFEEYVKCSFRTDVQSRNSNSKQLRNFLSALRFRLIPSVVYLQKFRSDRSHMTSGVPMPQYPPICSPSPVLKFTAGFQNVEASVESKPTNMVSWINMMNTSIGGQVVDLTGLQSFANS